MVKTHSQMSQIVHKTQYYIVDSPQQIFLIVCRPVYYPIIKLRTFGLFKV